MEHRYGRHGPRAWLRWRQRRYGRPSRLPVPVEPQPTIVRVFIPAHAERIIFIIMSNTPNPGEPWQPPAAEIQGATADQPVDGSTSRRLPPDPFHFTKAYAGNDAERQAAEDWDLQEVKSDPDDLHDSAMKAWRIRTDNSAIIEEMRGDRVKTCNAFVSAYKAVYGQTIQSYNGNMADVVTSKVRKQARNDQEYDSDRGETLSDFDLRCRAVIGIYRQLRLDTLAENAYLDIFREHVPVYEEAYTRYRRLEKEVGRSPRPRGF
jgi:hypothetical protein